MQLVRRQAALLAQSKGCHAGDCAGPHCQNHPAKQCSLRSLERVKQAGKKHHPYHTPAEVSKNVARLAKEIRRDFIAEPCRPESFEIEIDPAHPAGFRMANSIEHRINRYTSGITADRII